MEKDIALGSVAELKLVLEKGKAVVSIGANKSALDGAVSFESATSVSADAGAFVDMLFAAIEKASPAGVAPLEETVKALVKSAVMAIQ